MPTATSGPPSSEEVLSVINANRSGTQCLAPQTVAAVAYAAGFRGRDLVMAVQISMAEDGSGDPRAVHINSNGSRDRGLWQINSIHKQYSDDFCFNPGTCAVAAYEISGGGKNWKPWSTFNNGNYKKFQGIAEQAAAAVEASGGGSTDPLLNAGPAGAVYRTSPRQPQVTLAPDPAPLHTPDTIQVRGTSLGQLLGQFTCTGTIDLTMDGIPSVELSFTDPDLKILNAAWLDLNTPVTWAEWILEITSWDIGANQNLPELKLGFWPRGASKLKQQSGESREGVTAGEWIAAECAKYGVGVLNFEGTALVGSVGPATDTTGKTESIWDTISRLASENGCIAFMDLNALLVYGKPTEMVLTRERFDIGYQGTINGDSRFDVWEIPRGHNAIDKVNALPTDRQLDFKLPRWRAERIRAGMRCVTNFGESGHGYSKLNDDNRIVQEVSWTVDRDGLTPVSITAVLPTDPTPTGDPSGAAGGVGSIGQSAGGLNKGSKNASDFVAFAQSMTGKPYKQDTSINYLTAQNPADFDCSSLVQWSAAQVGIQTPRTSQTQYAASEHISVQSALTTRGALLFAGDLGHVAISLGDGHSTIQARKPGTQVGVVTSVAGFNFTKAGLIKGMNYGPSQSPAPTFGGTQNPQDVQNNSSAPGDANGHWQDNGQTGPNGQQVITWVPNF